MWSLRLTRVCSRDALGSIHLQNHALTFKPLPSLIQEVTACRRSNRRGGGSAERCEAEGLSGIIWFHSNR